MKHSKINKIITTTILMVIGLCVGFSSKIVSQQIDFPSVNMEDSLFYDSPSTDLARFFIHTNKEYHIRYNHIAIDTVFIPDSCVICFEGGSISAPIKFKSTRLSGQIRLKGSSISGSVVNDIFDASWLCHMDGKSDDAKNINGMLSVTDNIFFPNGDYYLKSRVLPSPEIPKSLHSQLIAHIGLHKSNVNLFGQRNTRLISDTPIVMICAYSVPNHIGESISNISLDNITFVANNDKENFHEFAHTVKLIGVNHCSITNCRFEDFWGDAIALSHYGDNVSTGERTRNQNIIIRNNYISGKGYNNRNAISVISGQNVHIISNIIDEVSNRNMPGAIDVEANNEAYTVENINIAYNRINGSNGAEGAICIVSQHGAPANRILIDHNIITNSTTGIAFIIKSNDKVSDITVTNNFIDNNTKYWKFIGNSRTRNWIVKNNKFPVNKQDFGGNISINNIYIE